MLWITGVPFERLVKYHKMCATAAAINPSAKRSMTYGPSDMTLQVDQESHEAGINCHLETFVYPTKV
jgi:hypothetical protein